MVFGRGEADGSTLPLIQLTPESATLVATVVAGGVLQRNDGCIITAVAVVFPNEMGRRNVGNRSVVFTDANTFASVCTDGLCEAWLMGEEVTVSLAVNGTTGHCAAAGVHNIGSLTESTVATPGSVVLLPSSTIAQTNGATNTNDECVISAGTLGSTNAHSAGSTPTVLSGSTIASTGSKNCKNEACSVMSYAIPLADHLVPNHDEIEIRVVAYNTRGIVVESVVFGWSDANPSTHDVHTIEYCGCTLPTDKNYWALATYNQPEMCHDHQSWDNADTTSGHMLTTVLLDEFDYYQVSCAHYSSAV